MVVWCYLDCEVMQAGLRKAPMLTTLRPRYYMLSTSSPSQDAGLAYLTRRCSLDKQIDHRRLKSCPINGAQREGQDVQAKPSPVS